MSSEICIVIADDHPIVRQGLRQAIKGDATLRVVAEAEDGEAALRRLRNTSRRLRSRSGYAEAFRSGTPNKKTVTANGSRVLTIHGEEDLFQAAMDLGAKGRSAQPGGLTCKLLKSKATWMVACIDPSGPQPKIQYSSQRSSLDTTIAP